MALHSTVARRVTPRAEAPVPRRARNPGAKALIDSVNNPTRRKKAGGGSKPPAPPKPPRRGGGGGRGDDAGPWFRVPEGCPVIPLGIDGEMLLFVDASRQFRAMKARDLGGNGLASLFGGQQSWLDQAWPRLNVRGDVIGLEIQRATRSLIQRCHEGGVFDMDASIRGVGAWKDIEGNLLWHLGDTVLQVDQAGAQSTHAPGLIGEHMYPLGARQPHAAGDGAGDPLLAIDKLLAILSTWKWSRGDVDARLQLGWIGCGFYGGALDWRPTVWATGGQGTGKTTLHNLVLKPLFGGDGAVVVTSDATGAGLHQTLRNRSTPIVFDELEPSEGDQTKMRNVINLAKQAASGGQIQRGSSEGKAHTYTVRSAFLFSSINIPRLEPEHAMRICVLDLKPLGNAPELDLPARDMMEIGRAVRRVLIERWQHWPARLEMWRGQIRAVGFSARIADTFGGLLAMSDHLLSRIADPADTPQDIFDVWISALTPHLHELIEASGHDWMRLLQVLQTTTVDPYAKGRRWPLSQLLTTAAHRRSVEDNEDDTKELTYQTAAAGLQSLGLKVVHAQPPTFEGERKPEKIWALAVVSNHTELNRLLRETKWGRGVYVQTLLRCPGAWSTQQRVAQHRMQCTMIPLDVVVPAEGVTDSPLAPVS